MQRPEDYGLAYVFKSAFVERVRTAGEQYFRDGKVQIVARDAETLSAQVAGTDTYDVQIRFDHSGGGVGVLCSCPSFGRWGPCKHVWATVLQADRHRGEGLTVAAADWRERLEFLREAREHADARPWLAVAAAHASRVLYRLEATRSDESDQLVLRTFYQRRLKNGGWGRPRPFAPELSNATVHLESVDELFFKLAPDPEAAQPGWRAGYFRPRFEFRLEGDLCRELLPGLAASGRLFLDDEDTRPLAWDAGEPWCLRLGLVPTGGEGARDGATAELELEPRLVRGEEVDRKSVV